MILQNNTRLQNRYLIVRLLGKGGFGAVYEARDLRLGHRVALTVGVAQVLTRALSFDPDLRPQSAVDMSQQLKEAIPAPQPPPEPPIYQPPPQPPNPSSSFSWPLGIGVGLILLLLGLVAVEFFRPPPPPATPTLEPGATAMAEIDGMVQVYVPAGDFEMGSAEDDPDANSDENPQHTVYLDAFWIDQIEVTNAMFAEFLNQQGNQEEGGVTWLDEANWALIEQVNGSFQSKNSFADHPAIGVSWYGATAYCAWAERRLPTEAEWEKAAGGILTQEGPRRYPWGNDAPSEELANYSGSSDGYSRTSPVGNYPAGASPYGALDMAGNVWEWVSDSYDSNYYASSPRKNPSGPSTIITKALRGGSWDISGPDIRVRDRGRGVANLRDESVGFRCARYPRESH